MGWSCGLQCTGVWLCELIGQCFRFPFFGDRILAQGISASTATSICTQKNNNHAPSIKQFRPSFSSNVSHPFTRRARLSQRTQRITDSRLVAYNSECLRTLSVAPQHQHILVIGRRAFKEKEVQGTWPTIIRMMKVEGKVSLAWNDSLFNPEGNLTLAIESGGTYIPSRPARKKGFFKKLFGCTCVSTE